MSIEAKIEELTAALEKLTQTVNNIGKIVEVEQGKEKEKEVEEKPIEKPKKEKVKKDKPKKEDLSERVATVKNLARDLIADKKINRSEVKSLIEEIAGEGSVLADLSSEQLSELEGKFECL